MSMPDSARRAMNWAVCGLLDLVFPDECRVCGDPLNSKSVQQVSRIPVCDRCLKDVQPLRAEFYCVACRTPFINRHPLDETGRCGLCRLGLNGFDRVYSYGAYEGTLRALIHLFKFGNVRPLAPKFGELLSLALPPEERFDAMVPTPLHWRRRWERGFNQSELLARAIARRRGVPVLKAVRRSKATPPQAGLTSAQRRENVRGAFAPKMKLDGMRVLLVDDVLTTGATASACARALKRAGASHVSLLALARRDRRSAWEVAA